MNEKINIINASGLRMQADIICMFDNLQTGRRFVYYTLNEISGTAPNNNVKIYISKVRQGDQTIDTPITDQEWSELKGIMSEILKGVSNTSIKYVPYISGSEIISISDKQIAMPISYEYIAKHQEVYKSNVVNVPQQQASNPAINDQVAPVIEQPTVNEPVKSAIEPAMVNESVQAPILETPVVNTPTEPIVNNLNPNASIQVEQQSQIVQDAVMPQSNITVASDIIQPVVDNVNIQPVNPVDTMPVQESVVTPQTQVVEPTVPKIELPETPKVVEPVNNNITIPSMEQVNTQFVAINIQEIDDKYDKLIKDFTDQFNSLREREKEAANNINSQNELMMMQKAQHAEYVKNEQEREMQKMSGIVNPIPVMPDASAPAASVNQEIQSGPIEPTPVTPVQPVIPQDSSYLETNWFDVQNN